MKKLFLLSLFSLAAVFGASKNLEIYWIDAGGEVLELSNGAVSTSGAAEQHLGPYSHIVDPASGMGITGSFTVTVMAPHGIDADGLATAVSVLGRERGMALVRTRPGASAILR